MSRTQKNTGVWKCDACGAKYVDAYSPDHEGDTDFEDHSLIPRGWCETTVREKDGYTRTNHFCSVNHMISFAQDRMTE